MLIFYVAGCPVNSPSNPESPTPPLEREPPHLENESIDSNKGGEGMLSFLSFISLKKISLMTVRANYNCAIFWQ